MKAHRTLTPRQETAAENNLYRAVLTLRSVAECRAFFHDLCTPAELQAMSDRWGVVDHLLAGEPYRQISEKTGVSVTTIGRVARCLGDGNRGYLIAQKRLAAPTSR
ncbi:MAG: YerC/YecD family TrpR-related protein [Pseudomonadota bacterium]